MSIRTYRLDSNDVAHTVLTFRIGEVSVIVGPNGVGKSALLDEISIRFPDYEKFSGYRQISFQNEDIDQLGQSLDAFQLMMKQSMQSVNRYRNPWGEQHLKSVIRRLSNAIAQAREDLITTIASGAAYGDGIVLHPQVLDNLNNIFQAAGIPVAFGLRGGVLTARRAENWYSIDRLSDGERAALLLAGAILIQQPGSFLIIDEPEKHLHPSIFGPFISAAVRCRPDLGYIFATHDLQLTEFLSPAHLVHVRDSRVISHEPETREYELTVVPGGTSISEDLQRAVLGARRKLLLVEGDLSSYDLALYSLIYPDWKVEPRGGWETVVEDTKSLLRNASVHRLEISGIIDGDGRSFDERQKFAESSVYCLPCISIENLFLHPEILQKMAESAHGLYGGSAPAERMTKVEAQLEVLLKEALPEAIVKQVAWLANRQLSENKISDKQSRQGIKIIPEINVDKIREETKNRYAAILSQAEIWERIAYWPVKKSGIPNKLCKIVGFSDFESYRSAVIRQIEIGSDAGREIREAFVKLLPILT